MNQHSESSDNNTKVGDVWWPNGANPITMIKNKDPRVPKLKELSSNRDKRLLLLRTNANTPTFGTWMKTVKPKGGRRKTKKQRKHRKAGKSKKQRKRKTKTKTKKHRKAGKSKKQRKT